MEHQEILEELRAIRAVMEQTRRAIGRTGGGRFLVLWGAVWLLGFLGTQFLPHHWIGWMWGMLNVIGVAGSVWLGIRLSLQVRSPLGLRIFFFWLASIAFALLAYWLFGLRDEHLGLLFALIIALALVQLGLLSFSTGSIWLGLLIAALALIGFHLFPAYFSLIMSFLGGGLMIGTGLWIIRRWE